MCVSVCVCVFTCACVCVRTLFFWERGGGGGGGVQCSGDCLLFLMCPYFHIECLFTHRFVCDDTDGVCVCVCVCVCARTCGGGGGISWHVYVCMLRSDIFMYI